MLPPPPQLRGSLEASHPPHPSPPAAGHPQGLQQPRLLQSLSHGLFRVVFTLLGCGSLFSISSILP